MSEGGQEDNNDKPFEPTQKKLEDARDKGEIARSTDMTVAATYAGFLLACLLAGPNVVDTLGSQLLVLLDRPEDFANAMLGDGGRTLAGGYMGAVSGSLSALFLVPIGVVLASLVALRGFAPSGQKLSPKLSRIGLLSNAKNKFGRSGLFEFAKSLAKLVIYSVVLGVYLTAQAPRILSTVYLEPGPSVVLLGRLSMGFLAVVLAVSLAIGAVDMLWQRAEHMRKNRMSHKEMKDEQKQSEGDPHMKQERRQRGYDIATNRMLADVPEANVVIVNPEHYAVALAWGRSRSAAPVCVAKGVDEIAARIRETAAEAGVPIRRDPPTARSLYATVEIGAEIDRAHYRAVAAAIRFADRMRSHAKPKR